MAHMNIVDVWRDNLEEEMEKIREIVGRYRCVSMDTEFPGVVARPVGEFQSSTDYHYQTLRCNVDLLKIIQIGLTFSDENGNYPESGPCVWQFNFRYSLREDMYAQDSIDLLIRSGIDFAQFEERGIDVDEFGAALISSGLVLEDDVQWISFHSGYDFGYLLKVLTCKALPVEEREFFEVMRTYFPCVYDIKYLMKSCKELRGGLNDLADALNVSRVGPKHQAGSDSLLTSSVFFRLRSLYFEDELDQSKYAGVLFGLSEFPNSASLALAESSDSLENVGSERYEDRNDVVDSSPLLSQAQSQQHDGGGSDRGSKAAALSLVAPPRADDANVVVPQRNT
jgi:CCR4-NOT transcription complex subunit 7/8